MNIEKKSKKLVGGTIVLGSIVGLTGLQANATEMFNYNELGSGSEVRAQLLQSERIIDNAIELSCGEKKAEGKSSEHKCGEGKCGEEGKKKAKAKEGKAAESKCGEGKCGEEGKKKAKTKEGKATESKCGEGKCGEGKCGGIE